MMFHRVLIPEGRIDYEWMRHLLHVSDAAMGPSKVARTFPPFGAVVGVVPTIDSLNDTCQQVLKVRSGLVALADGDNGGDAHIQAIGTEKLKPEVAVQWPKGWTIEDVVGWILAADAPAVLQLIKTRFEAKVVASDIPSLVTQLKAAPRDGGLKGDYVAYEELAGAMVEVEACVERGRRILDVLCCASLDRVTDESALVLDTLRTTADMKTYRVDDARLSV
jgi:hypothetical protein